MYGLFLFRVIIFVVIFCKILSFEIADHPNWKNLPNEECGYGALSDRIVGGNIASLGQFPWIARIAYEFFNTTVYFCAGSIINKWFILTTLHCIREEMGDKIRFVRLGENYAKSETDCEDDVCAPPVQDIMVEEVIKYDQYDETIGSTFITYGDIGLIKLATAIQFNDYVQPICLPRGKILDKIEEFTAPNNLIMEVAGWGKTESQIFTNKLLYVRMPIVDRIVCMINFLTPIDQSHLCVGAGDGNDSCTGDSGGPLMTSVSLDGTPRSFIFGIVAYGKRICGISAAVYTNVMYFLKWILDHIEK